ncbi:MULTISPECIES: hypothetical protein [unclassified Thioalkalivibrio]|uniref:hypothetical protein n=1 Tax=unclassified Thioalkalivibrio TaxID=2621013 RepID=UPI00035DB57F|nr:MULTISPECIES: hypothetical protein [unclassified Thioalkalivibrio]
MILPAPELRVLAVFQRDGTTIHDYLFNYLWKNFSIRLDCERIEDVTHTQVRRADVVLIAACNASMEHERLLQIESWSDGLNRPVLNRPGALLASERVALSHKLQREGIATARVKYVPDRESLLTESELRFPLILRSELSHLGTTMKKVDGVEDLYALDDGYFHSRTIAAEFFDYVDADGYYRKYRCAVVGDSVIPRHVISSRDWNIHADSRDKDRIEQHRKEHTEFVNGELAESAELLRAREATGLDYAIVDYALMRDGRPFIFEMNPCYSIMDAQTFKRPSALALREVHHYCRAFGEFLYRCAGRSAPVPQYATEPLVL